MSDGQSRRPAVAPVDLELDLVALDSLFDGLYAVDRDKRIRFWNQAAEQITGYSREEVVGRACSHSPVFHASHDDRCLCASADCPLEQTRRAQKSGDLQVRLRHRDGYSIPVLTRSRPILQGELAGGDVVFFREDIQGDDAQKMIAELREYALIDVLTGLPNRRYLDRRLKKRLEEFARTDHSFGLIFADIDDFKAINDRFGHDAGDQVLRQIGKTLVSTVRSYDSVGRWGGEEFVFALSHVDAGSLAHIAEKIRSAVEGLVVDIGAQTLRVTLSMGVTLARKDDSLDEMLRRADVLMYLSKKHGKNCVTMDPAIVAG